MVEKYGGKCIISYKKYTSTLFIKVIISIFIVLTSGSAYAYTEDITASVSAYAEAHASASGDTTASSTHTEVVDSSTSAFASAIAISENGGTATAIAEALVNWRGKSSSYAKSAVTAISEIGTAVFAKAYVFVSASDDSAISKSTSDTGIVNIDYRNGGIREIHGGNTNEPKLADKKIDTKHSGFFGFDFLKSDVERYYYFKNAENITGMQLSDSNHSYRHARAKYYRWVLAWDRGLNETQFEEKYPIVSLTQEARDRINSTPP